MKSKHTCPSCGDPLETKMLYDNPSCLLYCANSFCQNKSMHQGTIGYDESDALKRLEKINSR